MPYIDWSNVEESEGSAGSRDLPAGGYVCQITKAEFTKTKAGQDALVLVYDIAEGQFKGHFGAEFYANKDFRHRDYLMLEGRALGMTKHKLHMLADSNPGFDPTAAINADQAGAFVGKLAGLVIGQELYTYNGRDYARNDVVAWKSVDAIRKGDFEAPEVVDKREKRQAEPVATDLYAEDVPF